LNARFLASSDISLAGRLYVSGAATFVTAPIMSGANITSATIPQLSISGITSAIINDTTTQTVGGIKTFTSVTVHNSDISLNARLLASSDVSLAGRLYVSGAATFVTAPIMSGANINTATIPQLAISGITSAIINDTTAQTVGGIKTFTNTIISNSDISLNARLLASSDVSLAGRLYVSGASTFVTAPIMSGANIASATIPIAALTPSVNGSIVDTGSTQSISGLKTFTSKATFNDISANGNVVIYGNLTVQQVQNANIINTTINNYQLIISEDISLNGRLYVSADTSLNGNLYVANKSVFNNDISINGNTAISGYSKLAAISEKIVAGPTFASTMTFNINQGAIFTVSPTSNTNFNAALINVPSDLNRTFVVSLLIDAKTNNCYANAMSINGANMAGNLIFSGGAANVVTISGGLITQTFAIINTASGTPWKVISSVTSCF
jgi:hypothetical protein